MSARNTIIGWFTLALSVALSGCAQHAAWLKPTVPDVRPIREKQAREALDSFEKQRNQAEYQAARTALREGQHETCRTMLANILRRDPQHAAAQVLMLELMSSTDAGQDAIQAAAAARQRFANNAQVQFACFLVYDEAGQNDLAVECLTSAVRLAPGEELYAQHLEALEADAVDELDAETAKAILMGVPRARSEGGKQHRNPSLSNTPDDIRLLSLDEPVGSTVGVSPDKLANLESADKWLRRGTGALIDGHLDTADAYFDRAEQAAPGTDEMAVRIVVTALRHEEPEYSIQRAQRALLRYPESAGLYRTLGTAQYRLGRYAEARQAFEHALVLDNSSGLTYFLMGCTLSKLGDTASADHHYRQAQQRDSRLLVK